MSNDIEMEGSDRESKSVNTNAPFQTISAVSKGIEEIQSELERLAIDESMDLSNVVSSSSCLYMS